jgi:hypothetical protein
MCILPRERVQDVRCQPKTYPCPTCGKRGRRVRRLDRRVRSLAYRQVAWLHVYYAEYQARCSCCSTFRSWPLDVPPKADYDSKVRAAVLDRILEDGLNVERTRAALNRDFLLELSSGFIYDCLDAELRRLSLAANRRHIIQEFSGILCVDELHLGQHTLLLATDPVADRIVGYLLVGVNDQPHLRKFLRMLAYWGFAPKVVVTDGSNLYPGVLAEVWPTARHQLCVFHVLQDVNRKVLDAVRRLRRQQARRGKCGRKRGRGRPSKKQQRRRNSRGLRVKDKAAFVFKHRYLIVKRSENLSEKEALLLEQMLEYLPELRILRKFCASVYELFSPAQLVGVARRRRTMLLKRGEYQEVPELEQALGLLEGEKFDKMIGFLECPTGERVRTNNHVERANRQLRFAEKLRYKWRSIRSLERYLYLRISRLESRKTTRSAQNSTPRKGVGCAGD